MLKTLGFSLGESLKISDPEGKFDVSRLSSIQQLILLAAGTGFTPMAKVITATRGLSGKSVTLLFFNKTEKDIIWRDQLDRLERADSSFVCHHILSDPSSDWQGLSGRITASVLEQLLPKPEKGRLALVCGPNPFTLATERS